MDNDDIVVPEAHSCQFRYPCANPADAVYDGADSRYAGKALCPYHFKFVTKGEQDPKKQVKFSTSVESFLRTIEIDLQEDRHPA